MNQLIITIPITVGNSVIAENMIDWIYQLNGRVPQEHALICFDADVTPERHERIKLACELAFESFDTIIMPTLNTKEKMASENAVRNNLFLGIAEHCRKSFRIPWLWLEPGSVPTQQGWFKNICDAYYAQPRRYLGTHLKPSAESNDRFLHPVSVYHMGCFDDVVRVVKENMDGPFEMAIGNTIVPRSTKWRAVQFQKILDESDIGKVWPEAEIVFGDDGGMLIEAYRAEGRHHPKVVVNPEPVRMVADASGQFTPHNPPPDGARPSPNWITPPSTDAAPRIDLRTKAGRALKAAQKAEHANAH